MYPNGTEVARINKKSLILSNYYIPAEVRFRSHGNYIIFMPFFTHTNTISE